jgi:hypothetical protein
VTNSGDIPSLQRQLRPDIIKKPLPPIFSVSQTAFLSAGQPASSTSCYHTLALHHRSSELSLCNMDSNNVYKQVQDHYGSLARAEKPSYSGAIAQAFGYTEEELNTIPRDSNLGLSCGNPLAIASLREASSINSQVI